MGGKVVRRILAAFIIGLPLVVVSPTAVRGQPKPGYVPSSTHMFPAGGRRGTRVVVRVGSECLPPGAQLNVFGHGVAVESRLVDELSSNGEPSLSRKPTETPITYPREWQAELQIDPDAPIGTAFWRLHCAQGGTGTRPFVVGELPEFVEAESNSAFDTAEHVTLPLTVNGQINGERDVDWYRFSTKPGQVVSCEVLAGRLGSPLDPVIDIYDAAGQRQVVDRAYIGSDPVLVFRATSAADYLVRVSHVNHRGDPSFVYRMNLVPRPFVRCAYPAAGRSGTTASVDFLLLDGSGRFQPTRREVRFPDEAGDFVFDTSEFGANPVTLSSQSGTVSVEREPNNDLPTAQDLPFPACVFGQYASPRDRDVYRLQVQAQQRLTIHCRPESPGNPALPMITLRDAAGKVVARVSSATTEGSVCRLNWTASSDGSYYLTTSDVRSGSRGDQDFVYRLSVAEARPDFELVVDQDVINLQPGQEAVLNVKLNRLGGFDKPVELQVDGLADGIELSGQQIAANSQLGKLKFKPGDKSASRTFNITLRGTAVIGEQTLTRIARCRHLGVDMEGVSVGDTHRNQLSISVLHKPLFRLFCQEAYLYAHRGSVFPYPMQIERLNGFDGEVHLQIGDRQNRDLDGIQMRVVTIPPGESSIDLPIYLPESMAINVQSQSQLYSQAWARFTDAGQRAQSVLVLSEKRNMLRTLPPVFKLRALQQNVTVKADGTAECRLRLKRTSNAPGPVTIVLHRAPDGVDCEPRSVSLRPEQTEATMLVRVAKGFRVSNARPLVFRATGFLENGIEVITEAAIRMEPTAGAAGDAGR